MANWFTTDYTFIGDENELDSLYNELMKIEEKADTSRGGDFNTHWLGFVVEAMGGDVKEVPCRGKWYDLKRENGTLTVSTFTANACYNGIMSLICDKYESLKYYYRSVGEFSDSTTNDRKGKFYRPYRLQMFFSQNEDGEIDESFRSKEDLFKWLSDRYGQNITSEDDISDIDGVDDVYITEYKYISSSERAMADSFLALLWQGKIEIKIGSSTEFYD